MPIIAVIPLYSRFLSPRIVKTANCEGSLYLKLDLTFLLSFETLNSWCLSNHCFQKVRIKICLLLLPEDRWRRRMPILRRPTRSGRPTTRWKTFSTRWRTTVKLTRKIHFYTFVISISSTSGSQPFTAHGPLSRKIKLAHPTLALVSCFIENIGVILKLMIIWRTPCDFSRTPGWGPLS